LSGILSIKRDRAVPVDTKLLRQIARTLLRDVLAADEFDLGVHVVRSPEMTRLNQTFLRHPGSTDVITFDYSELSTLNPQLSTSLHGEIFICYDDALSQARQFRTTWQSEIVRYLIHGVLHLRGFDDHRAADRRVMKREENRLLRELGKRFRFTGLKSS